MIVRGGGISNDAVVKGTGKGWDEWFEILDKAGASELPHPEIARLLKAKHNTSDWWSQMLTVGYERERGRRELHQRMGGYVATLSRTVPLPVDAVYAAWRDARVRARWLKTKGVVVRKATENKGLRITWPDGSTSLEVNFYPKGANKCQFTVEHSKLTSGKQVQEMKAFWADAVGRLKQAVTV